MPKTSARLLLLLSLLQARRDWPAALLAERLEVSARTVRRDVDRLRELGYPISTAKGPDGGYRLAAGSHLPPLLFDDEQAVALALALQSAATAGTVIEEDAMRALNTVRQVMPDRLRRRIDLLHFASVEQPSMRPRAQVDPQVLVALGAAVHAREVLRFDYESASARPDTAECPGLLTRRVQPHHLVAWSRRWYLVAWDLDRQDWRIFRADRLTPRSPTGPRFTPRDLPADSVAAFVVSRFRGSNDGFAGWPCRGEVILNLPASHVDQFVGDGIVEELGPDRCRLVLGSWSWPALAATICRFDADIEVVDPVELRTAFAHLARRSAEAASHNVSHS